jgi:large repetitive protein
MTSQSVTQSGAGGPVAWYPLTQTSGTTVSDPASGGQTATAPSGTDWTGSAASFTGTSGQQITTSGPVLDTTGSFTVSAWVYLASDSSQQTAVSQTAGTDSGFYLKYDSSDEHWEFMRPETDTTSPSTATAASTSDASTDTWTLLTGTYNANTGTMTLYVNGTANGTYTDSTPIASHGALTIGASQWNGKATDFFDGEVSDVQVYPRSLSASEVSTLYGYGEGGSDITSSEETTSWTRDERGLPTSMTDPDGNVTDYSYDEAGQLAVTTEPTVSTETYSGGTVTAHPVEMTGYDTFGDTTESEDADGNVTTYGYDADGQEVSQTEPSYTQPGTGTVINAETTYGYDGDGNETSQTDAVGNETTYAYDQLSDKTSETNAAGDTTSYTYDPDGEELSQTSPTGAVSEATYDYLGRQLTSTQVERYATGDTSAAYTTDYTYGTGGWLWETTTPDGVTSKDGYDAAGELTSVEDGAGSTTTYKYDALGRQTATVYPDGTSTVTGYDSSDDVTSTENLDSSGDVLTSASATYDGDGNELSSTDARGDTTTYTYDPTGMLTQEVQPVTSSSAITTSFGYDGAGNETEYTDGNGNNWYYTYNSWGLEESRIEPTTSEYSTAADSTYTTAYDADGRPLSETEPGGVTVSDAYNNVGELTGQSGSGADATTATRTFGYDASGDLTSASTSDTASSSSASNATSESYTYDDRGDVLTASGTGGSTSYTYNGDDLVTSVDDAAGTTSYTYDDDDRLSTLSDPATGTTATYSYDEDSELTEINYGSDARHLAYNSQHEETGDTLETSTGSTVASTTYGYNADGQITSETTSGLAGASSNTYSYDEAGRLTSWDNGATTTDYVYDADGNLTADGSKTYTYDARDELTSDGTDNYTYTANGTLSSVSSSSATTDATYDAFGDQVSYGTQSYDYDALGRMTSDVNSSTSSGYTFSYQGATGTLASDGTSTYTWDPSGTDLVGVGVSGGTASEGVLAYTDQHDDVTGEFTSSSTAVTGSTGYDPWGTVTATSGTEEGQLGYQSEWTDPVTGKVAMGSRWYDPSDGDFMSADTMQVAQAPDEAAANPYAYVGDDPLDGTDPTGHCWFVCSVVNAIKHVVKRVVHTVARVVKKVVKAAVRVVRDVSHAVKDAAERGVRAVHTVVDYTYHYVDDAYHAVTQYAVRAVHRVVHIVKAAVHKVVHAVKRVAKAVVRDVASAAHKVASAMKSAATHIRKAAVWTADHVQRVAAAATSFVASHANTITQVALAAGAVALTIANVAQLGLDPLTDAAEVADVGALTADAGAEGAEAVAEGGESAAETGEPAEADSTGDDDSGDSCEVPAGAVEGGQSFTAGTKVLLASGSAVAISRLRPGDKVLAFNGKTGKDQAETVTAVLVHYDKDLYDLKVRSGSKTSVIDTTSSHLFWVPGTGGRSGRWVKAGALKYGTRLRTPGGRDNATVLGGWVPAQRDGWMWDLTVPGNNDHDFYIATTTADILVHNCGKNQGVYQFEDQWNPGKTYVGKSMNLQSRLGYWVSQGRLTSQAAADCLHVCGTEDDVFAAEAQRISDLEEQGVSLSNKIASPGKAIINARNYVQLPLW